MKRSVLAVASCVSALFAAVSPSAKTLVFCSGGSPENFYPGVNTTGTSFDANSQIYSLIVDFERGGTTVVIDGSNWFGRAVQKWNFASCDAMSAS